MDSPLYFWAVWVAGMVPASVFFHFLARYGTGSFYERRTKAVRRTALWPFALVVLLVQAMLVVGTKGISAFGAQLAMLATNARDIEEREQAEHEERLAVLTSEAEEAEARSAEMDVKLEAQRNPVPDEHMQWSPDQGVKSGLCQGAWPGEGTSPAPSGQVWWCDPETVVTIGTTSNKVTMSLVQNDTLLWHCEKTGMWHSVVSFSKVPAKWPVWQVDSAYRGSARRVKLKFWGYNNYNGE